MPKRLATGPMLAALIFAILATALIVVPYFEPSFTLDGNAPLLAVVASIATVLMIILAAIVGNRRDDDDDESLTEEDLVPSVAFGPHAGLLDDEAAEGEVLTRKQRKERKQAEKAAKKDAERRAKFERQAQKEAEKAAKKAAKKNKKGAVVDDDSDWISEIRDDAPAASLETDGEILETTSFQLPPPVDPDAADTDMLHAATAAPMFTDDEIEDDEYLTAAYIDPSFEIPYQEYADMEPTIADEDTPRSELDDSAVLDELADPDFTETYPNTEPLDDPEDLDNLETAEMEDENTMEDMTPADEFTTAATSRIEELAHEMKQLLHDVTIEADELRGHITDMADSYEAETEAIVTSLHEARAEVDRLNEEYATMTNEKRDTLALRSMLVEAENKALRAEIDKEQMLARLRQVRFSAVDGATPEELLAVLDRAFMEIDAPLDEAEAAENPEQY